MIYVPFERMVFLPSADLKIKIYDGPGPRSYRADVSNTLLSIVKIRFKMETQFV